MDAHTVTGVQVAPGELLGVRNSRLSDLLMLLFVVSVGAYGFHTWQQRSSPRSAPTPLAASPPAFQPQPRGFTLDRVGGGTFRYDGTSPCFVTLTAIGCQECRERVESDRPTVQFMRELGIPVCNILVYSDKDAGQAFVEQYHPGADLILVDPDASVSVRQWGGSDETCWFLLGEGGRLLYAGPARAEDVQRVARENFERITATPSDEVTY